MSLLPVEVPIDEDDLHRERNRARVLKKTPWWKNRRARGRCQYCGASFPARELTMDHVVPLVRGGKSVKSNLVPCCKACNMLKQDLVPSEWQEYLDRLGREEPGP